MEHQKEELKLNKIDFTENPKEDHDILLVNSTWISSFITVKRAKKQGKKVVIYAHMTAEDFKKSMVFSNFISPFLRKWLNFFYSQADMIFAPTDYTNNLLKTKYSKLKNKKIVTLSNGIDIKKWTPSPKKTKNRRRLVLGIGMFFERKGIIDFIETAKKIKEADFVWIGKYNKSISNNPKLNNAVKNAPKNFKHLGFVEDIKEMYNEADVFLFPSYEENEGIVVLEAAAMKKAIVVRDIPVFRSYLTDGKNARFASCKDDFVTLTKELLNNPNERKLLGENARKTVEKLDLKVNGRRLKKYLSSLLVH
jgi:1,2-diacylglycerol-3-alpha-glucose alpha-1,2-glucosyltransferase